MGWWFSVIINRNLIGKRFDKCSFDNYIVMKGNELALAMSKKFVSGEVNSLVIIGAPGRGKTHLAVSAIRSMDNSRDYKIIGNNIEFSAKEMSIVYMPQYDLVRSLRQEIMAGSRDTLNSCIQADVLAIDDLGVGGEITQFLIESVEYIIDSRYKNMLQTIITTNLSMSEIARAFSPRIVSRFAEAYAVVEISTDRDYRVKRHGDINGI